MILELPALVNPEIGLIFWMTLTFVAVLFILRKFAWKPILTSLKEREDSIENSLQQAENARAEMAKLNSQNEALLAETRRERDGILKEAREIKEKIVSDAKHVADEEARRMIARAHEEITREKNLALEELKKEVAGYSVQIAEKLLGQKLSDNAAQRSLIADQLSNLSNGQNASS